MPPDLVVRESRGLLILMVLFGVGLLVLFLPMAFEALANGSLGSKDLLAFAGAALGIFCVPLAMKSALQRKVVLVAFKRGLFFPELHPDVIPWNCVERVDLSHIGKGTSVSIVFTPEFETRLHRRPVPRFFFSIEKTIGFRGRLFRGLHDHSNPAVVHAIDDWIRYETRQAPKPHYRPGIVDTVLSFLGGGRSAS